MASESTILATFIGTPGEFGGLVYAAEFPSVDLRHDVKRILEKNSVEHSVSDNAPYTITITAAGKQALADDGLFQFTEKFLVTFTNAGDKAYQAVFKSEEERDNFVGFLGENNIDGIEPGQTKSITIGQRTFPGKPCANIPASQRSKLENIDWVNFAERSFETGYSKDISPSTSHGVRARLENGESLFHR